MNVIEEIRNWEKKPKKLLVYLADKAKKDNQVLKQLAEGLKKGSDKEKGVCAEVFEYVSNEKPELVVPFVSEIIKFINCDVPRVKWETARGNWKCC